MNFSGLRCTTGVRSFRCHLGVVLICASPMLCSPCIAFGQADAEPIWLQEGQPTAPQQHSAEAPLTYGFQATPGGKYLFLIEQDLDVIATLESPDGSTMTFDSPLLRDEREVVYLERAESGPYLITLRSDELTHALGTLTVRVDRMDDESPVRLEAWRLMSEGAAANAAGEWNEALELYERAAELWNSVGNTRNRAHALYAVAFIEYWWMLNWSRAAEVGAAVAELYRDDGQSALHANALQLRAFALIELANEIEQSISVDGVSPERQAHFDEALGLFAAARAIHEELGNSYDIAQIANNVGLTYYYMGEFDHARTAYREAEAIYREIGELRGELRTQNNQAVLDAEDGRLLDAIAAMQRSLETLPDGKEPVLRANTLDNLAASQHQFGNMDEALQAFTSALSIHRELDDLKGEGRSLVGLGQVYYSLGELELASDYLRQALPKVQEANDGRMHETVLRYLGNVAFARSEYEPALSLHGSAADMATSPPDRVHDEILIARDLTALGRHSEAAAMSQQARATAESVNSRILLANARQQLARAQLGAGDALAATENLELALAVYESLNHQDEQARALNGLAMAMRSQGRLEDAARYGEQSIARIESLRGRVSDPELRAFYYSVRQEYYETQISTLMALAASSDDSVDYVRAALTVNERNRARMTMDLLAEASIELRQNVDPVLARRQSELEARLAELRYQRDRLLSAPDRDPRGETLAAVVSELLTIEHDLNVIDNDIRQRSPVYSGLSRPDTLSADEMQSFLDDDTTLLQYSLGAERSYAWLITRDGIQAVELANRDVIEEAANAALRRLQMYQPTSAARSELDENLRTLTRLIVEPVADRLATRRLLIAAEGAMQYIPFSVLPIDSTRDPATRMIETYEIVAIPSISVLATQRARDFGKAPSKALAVFADPVFQVDDPRFEQAQTVAAVALSDASDAYLNRSSLDPLNLVRLPSTAHEADTIASLLPASDTLVMSGFRASRDAVLTTNLSQFRYLHFATHGLIDSRYPALSALALSRFDAGGAEVDGLLRLTDIYNLRLNADLVVLSACETALGREIRGEGLLGLTQGFLYAGARSLLVSLWQVSDVASATLMNGFYEHMIESGLRPAEALRRAQLSLAAERRFADPYFWAGFVLLGDS